MRLAFYEIESSPFYAGKASIKGSFFIIKYRLLFCMGQFGGRQDERTSWQLWPRLFWWWRSGRNR